MTHKDIDEFSKNQNRILVGGAIISIIMLFIGYFTTSVISFIGMGVLLVTFLICDIREKSFRDKLK